MKVLLINGSPKANGCTYTALSEVASEIEKSGIDTEILHIGADTLTAGCDEKVFEEAVEKAKQADGFIFGSPVHFAAASGVITGFLDRLFCAGVPFAHKPGAAVVSCRRGGASAAVDQLNKYFTISQMPVVSSNYWNMVHGNTPDEVKQDEEGMQTMRILGRNMAWMLKCIEAGKNAGIEAPVTETKIKTNYIR